MKRVIGWLCLVVLLPAVLCTVTIVALVLADDHLVRQPCLPDQVVWPLLPTDGLSDQYYPPLPLSVCQPPATAVEQVG